MFLVNQGKLTGPSLTRGNKRLADKYIVRAGHSLTHGVGAQAYRYASGNFVLYRRSTHRSQRARLWDVALERCPLLRRFFSEGSYME